MNKFFLILTAVFLISSAVIAQITPVEPVQNNVDILKQEGRLLSVRLTPGQPLKIVVVGREAGAIDFGKLKLTVRRLMPGPEKSLHVTKEGEVYMIQEPLEPDAKVEVKTEMKNHVETFRFKLNEKKP